MAIEIAPDMKLSFLRIRKIIGILGMLLPILLLFSYHEILPSLSHYYYTKGAIFFVAILTAFGLFLISYKGYEKDIDKHNDKVSDDQITIFGGFCILVVVIIPTSCTADLVPISFLECNADSMQLFGHNCKHFGTVHLISAALFLASMGYLSYDRFSRGRQFKKFYKACGVIVWACVFLLIIRFLTGVRLTNFDVSILETVAVVVFGASWLIKGKMLADMGIKVKA